MGMGDCNDHDGIDDRHWDGDGLEYWTPDLRWSFVRDAPGVSRRCGGYVCGHAVYDVLCLVEELYVCYKNQAIFRQVLPNTDP